MLSHSGDTIFQTPHVLSSNIFWSKSSYSKDVHNKIGKKRFKFELPRREVPQLFFQSEFDMSKIIQIFLTLKNKNSGAYFLLKWFFGNFNFKTTFLLKSGLIFDNAAKQPGSKSGRMANFVSPLEKLVCRRCRFWD